jgi:hypothetical protein
MVPSFLCSKWTLAQWSFSLRTCIFLLCSLMVYASTMGCNPSKKTPILGVWNVKSAVADPTNKTPEGLAARVWAETIRTGGTWEFRPDDSSVVTIPPDNDKRGYHFTLSPDGKSMVLFDQTMHKIDTLDIQPGHDSLVIFDRTRNIHYVMTLGAGKMQQDYP